MLWHGAGDSFCAGNDVEDFLKNPPGPGESPQARLMNALIDFDKPLVAAVQGAAIGGGTTMLTHCDFVYAGESAKFQMPFINLALVPEFGSSFSVPARIGHISCGGVDSCWVCLSMPGGLRIGIRYPRRARPEPAGDRDRNSAEAGGEASRRAAGQQAAHEAALRRPDQGGNEAENEEFSARVRSEEAKEALAAFLEKRRLTSPTRATPRRGRSPWSVRHDAHPLAGPGRSLLSGARGARLRRKAFDLSRASRSCCRRRRGA